MLYEHITVAFAQLLHQASRALDVREQEGDGPARQLGHSPFRVYDRKHQQRDHATAAFLLPLPRVVARAAKWPVTYGRTRHDDTSPAMARPRGPKAPRVPTAPAGGRDLGVSALQR